MNKRKDSEIKDERTYLLKIKKRLTWIAEILDRNIEETPEDVLMKLNSM